MKHCIVSTMLAIAFSTGMSMAHADAFFSDNVYLQIASTDQRSSTNAITIGATQPMTWSRSFLGTNASGYWDVYATSMRGSGRAEAPYKTWLLGLTPTLRLRLDEGRSPWFVEAGIGLSYSNKPYENQVKRFSTRFNFADHIGIGYNFGEARNHALVLRLQHFSNAGLKKPNPGENYVQLRYAYAF